MAKSDELAQKWLQAMDILVSDRTNSLNFDKTIKCEILSNTNAKNGEYTVTDSSSAFLAYSKDTEYKVGDRVQVTIPNGDWNETKIIVGRDTQDNNEPFAYTSPLNSFLDITENIIINNGAAGNGIDLTQEVGLAANGQTREKVIWSVGLTEEVNNQTEEYTGWKQTDLNQLAVAADFRTAINSNVYTGNYGLRIEYYTYHPDQEQFRWSTKKNVKVFSCKEFFGNPYKLLLKQQQAIVYSIDSFYPIIGMKIIFFQAGNFAVQNGIAIVGDDRRPNLFASNFYISLGLSIDSINQDTVFLYTLDKDTYLSKNLQDPSENFKKMSVRWIHRNDLGKFVCIDEFREFPKYEIGDNLFEPQATLRLYQFDLKESDSTPVDEEEVDTSTFTPEQLEEYNRQQRLKEYDENLTKVIGQGWQEVTITENNTTRPAFAYREYENNVPVKLNEIISSIRPYKEQERFKAVVEYPSRDYVEFIISQKNKTIEVPKEDNPNETEQIKIIDYAVRQRDAAQAAYNAAKNSGDFEQLSAASKVLNERQRTLNELLESIPEINYYVSDIFSFDNESRVPNYTDLELISGLTITCDPTGYNGSFLCYNTTGDIRNRADADKIRFLNACFNHLYIDKIDFDGPAESITWYLPVNNTMIQTPEEGVTFNLKDKEGQPAGPQAEAGFGIVSDSSSPYYGMFKLSYKANDVFAKRDDLYAGTIIPESYQQAFKIKDNYITTNNNNKVYCVVIKNKLEYIADYNMVFDINGNSGTKYTFILKIKDGKPAITADKEDSLIIEPHLYDYNYKEMDLSDVNVMYDWYSEGIKDYIDAEGNPVGVLSFNSIANSKNVEIKQIAASYMQESTTVNGETTSRWVVNPNKVIKFEDFDYYILCARVQTRRIDAAHYVTLTAYLPICVRAAEDYSSIEGNANITYSSSGTNPSYYKDTWRLHQINDNLVDVAIDPQNTVWSVVFDDDPTATKFYPSFSEQVRTVSEQHPQLYYDQKIVPTNLFMGEGLTKKVSAHCKIYSGNKLVWMQPLMIKCEAYESELMNAWDGSLTIDEKNGTILSSMVGAGIKTAENKFSGVFMGNVVESGYNNTGIGLYGYNDGVQSFGLKVDGTAFLGKPGRGQIQFNGNNGTIRSQDYSNNGTEIDLDDGIYRVKKSGNLIIRLQPTSPYFTLTEATGSHTLLNIADNNYYLQSSDYDAGSADDSYATRKGTKINLSNGQFDAFSNFRLDALTDGRKNGLYLSNFGTDTAPYLQIRTQLTDTTYQSLLFISKNKFQLKSKDFNGNLDNLSTDGSKGMALDLQKGIITGYNIKFAAYKNITNGGGSTADSSQGWIWMDSSQADYPLQIGTGAYSNAHFRVKWDGTLYATGAQFSNTNVDIDSGTVGSWIIDSGGHLYYATGSSPDIKNSTVLLSALGVTNNSLNADYKLSSDLLPGNNTDKPFMIKAGTNFAVSTDGTIYSKAGFIGGWKISNKELSKTVSKTYYTYLRAPVDTVTNDTRAINISIWDSALNNGNGNWASQFYVSYGGKMFAKNAEITGKITATEGYIGGTTGWTIKSTYIYNGVTSLTDTAHDGVYLGTNGIRLGKGVFTVTNAGALTATNATITGEITATSGYIGGTSGWTIESQILRNGTTNSTSDGAITLSTTDFTRSINGTSRSGLRLAIGKNFAVSKDGTVYAAALDSLTTSFNSISSTYATISSLDSAVARIGTLETDYANIGTLISEKISAASISADNISVSGHPLSFYYSANAGTVVVGGSNFSRTLVKSITPHYTTIMDKNGDNVTVVDDVYYSDEELYFINTNTWTTKTVSGFVNLS